MIERHYDDDTLVTLLGYESGVADVHLDTCPECAEKLGSFRMVTGALRDPATWDKREVSDSPNANTIAVLRAFANRTDAEDAAAEPFVANLLSGARETWAARLAAHPEYRTAGTVRRLIEATNRALDTMPADAVEITALATDIAEHLVAADYTADTVARLRGAVWRDRAFAFYYTGKISLAEKALNVSESHFRQCVLSEYELARLGVIRALVCRSLEAFGDARAAGREATRAFEAFGDQRRLASARMAEAHACFGTGDYRAAFEILTRAERELRASSDAETHARALGNLAYCSWKLNRIDEALRYHEAAAVLLDELGIHTESVRTRWNIAVILASEGRVDEALPRFEAVHLEFQRLGMTSVATLARLDAAELLLTRGRYDEVEEICRTAMQEFAATGLEHTERALTALALMKEAAASRTATPALIRQVREYIRRLPEEPNLLFLQPLAE